MLPYPIAAAWHRVTLSVSEAERLQRALLCLETVPRVLVALLLPDYLRGSAVDVVEERIEALRRPSLGQWVGLTRELLAALRARSEQGGPPPYLPDALSWAFAADGAVSHPMTQLDFLVTRRNAVAHGTTLGGQLQISDQANAFCDDLLSVLETLHWLGRYRVFRVLDQRATRRRTSVGRVQIFQGTEEFTEPVDAEWGAPLLQDAVYLLGPKGDGVLEVSPLMQVLADPEAKREHLCLVTAIPDFEKVALAHGSSGLERATLVETELGPVSFRDWLAERGQHEPYWPCSTLSGGLAKRAETALDPGAVVGGRFTIVGRLSSVPDGAVYRATENETGRDVVVRLLAVGEDPDAAVAELKRLRRLAHPHLVRVDEVNIGNATEGPSFLVMPFVPGPTLEDRLQSGSVSRAEASRWSAQILSAVAHLHDAGLVHGRIRPSSFLFDDASILLANLGLKRGVSGNEDQRAWLAPEQLRGEGTSAAADRYAAAAVLHALFTGVPPDAGPGQGLDGREGRTLRKLGARDPEQRLSVRKALERLTAAPTGPRPPPGGWPSCTKAMSELLNSAHDLAVAGGHGFLGLEHLVLALRRDARDTGVRRLWMLIGDTELSMRSVLAGLTPIEAPKDPVMTPRLVQWRDALDDGFDALAIEALLREDRGHALHELSAARSLMVSGHDGGASTLGIEQLSPMGGPTTLAVVGGPEDGRVLVTSDDSGWVGRHDGGTTVVAPLYLESPCTDRRLSRRHLHWREGAVELRRPAKALSALGDAMLRPGVHTLPAGTLLELTPSTRVRVQPRESD